MLSSGRLSTFSSVVVHFPTHSANALLTQDVVRVKHLPRWRASALRNREASHNDIINKNRGSLFTMPTIIEKLKLSWERHKLSYPHDAHFSSSEPESEVEWRLICGNSSIFGWNSNVDDGLRGTYNPCHFIFTCS